MKLNDKSISYSPYGSQCAKCKNLLSLADAECRAFYIIPLEILDNKFKHDKRHPDQENNILFEKKEK